MNQELMNSLPLRDKYGNLHNKIYEAPVLIPLNNLSPLGKEQHEHESTTPNLGVS